ncbi:aspartate-semialdehyde dehydrogenase [bacterium]|nr:aspartate-semialdehyde dehydrogenase [candidate division CSSED10-310 bacterium]
MARLRVGILGATGAVGQTFIRLLNDHPWFETAYLAASGDSVGKRYRDTRTWLSREIQLPPRIAEMSVGPCEAVAGIDLYFSALPSTVAGPVEARLADTGCMVVSNAASHRMDEDVPLLVPEVNPDHLRAVETQRARRSGCIVTNPNCTVAGLVLVLDALDRAFGLRRVMVSTLQALSGAGYPGVAAMDITDNILPFIPGEERKVETEPQKILGDWDGSGFIPRRLPISAQCTRVAVMDGHTELLSFGLDSEPGLEEVGEALSAYRGRSGEAQRLPSSPRRLISVRAEDDRPQPRYDRIFEDGMGVTVGRVRRCPVLGYKLVLLSHNMIRGAAGAAMLNAELLVAAGFPGASRPPD